MSESDRVRYEVPEPGVARVVLARPEKKNAQDKRMLYHLDDAFSQATADDDIKVIILAADGTDFSSGHDLARTAFVSEEEPFRPIHLQGGFTAKGAEAILAVESEVFVDLCWRWRNIPKPTIAQVHGRVIAGGLMLVWPMDLVIASEDATFSDPTVAFGLNGLEYHDHLWQLGARKAKEILFTGRPLTADEAEKVGMVNQVVPREQLEETTLAMARTIAERPLFGLKTAKLSINQGLEAQGQYTHIKSAYALHCLGHTHFMALGGSPIERNGKGKIRELSGAKNSTATSYH
ncbi:MAG TPA: enoyl-CoA hydratase [Acidimicrobiia bacterium]|nr:enoyl-CoA hydratase [Acidimicrobiia bacterium]